MDQVQRHIHVNHRRARLVAEAAAEHLAARQRRDHAGEHAAHPDLRHDHRATGPRAAVGRWLIRLGAAIAGSGRGVGAGRGAGVGRTA